MKVVQIARNFTTVVQNCLHMSRCLPFCFTKIKQQSANTRGGIIEPPLATLRPIPYLGTLDK